MLTEHKCLAEDSNPLLLAVRQTSQARKLRAHAFIHSSTGAVYQERVMYGIIVWWLGQNEILAYTR